jgi:hypothetical protein
VGDEGRSYGGIALRIEAFGKLPLESIALWGNPHTQVTGIGPEDADRAVTPDHTISWVLRVSIRARQSSRGDLL